VLGYADKNALDFDKQPNNNLEINKIKKPR
jgi:hypothetical protein